MRILITGSSGQLGREIARQLAPYHEIMGLDVLPGEWTTHLTDLGNLPVLTKLVGQAEAVIHTASLHARHLASHSKQAFIQTNITDLLKLLELCVQSQIKRFVYTSTTSVYGFAMVPKETAVWVTEAVPPQPRDIYDVTKLSAEQLCHLFSLEHGLKSICLRTSRFFPESEALLALYRLYRGADVCDVANAHVLAVQNNDIEFDIFNISANHPFQKEEMPQLYNEPVAVISRYYPQFVEIFRQKDWQLPTSIDRVYVTACAQEKLGYRPQYNFEEYIQSLS